MFPTSILPADVAAPIAGSVARMFEQVVDASAFAEALTASGAKLYGAFWCSHCHAQKELFGAAQSELPYVECSNPDHTRNQSAIDAGITSYPTWIFPDTSRHSGEMSFAELSAQSGVPLPMISAETQFATAIDNLMAEFGQSGLNLPADLDQDGQVNFDDLALAKENRPAGAEPLRLVQPVASAHSAAGLQLAA
jgi:hypothetical protein